MRLLKEIKRQNYHFYLHFKNIKDVIVQGITCASNPQK